MSAQIDWQRLAAVAAVRLGWPPESFWAATPVDLVSALRLVSGQGLEKPLDRPLLDELLQRFPDT